MLAVVMALAWKIETSLLDHAFVQWQATPEMRIEDAYKWLFHVTLGGEHAVQDESGPRIWLEREWPTVGAPMKGENEIVPLTPDGGLLRINLRPFKQRGGDKEMLLWAFVLSAEKFKSDKREFVRAWDGLGARLKTSNWKKLTTQEWKRLDATAREDNFPAIEHSAKYEKLYKPAYRVVLREMWLG